MRKAVIDKITAFANKNEELFLITGDAGFGVLDEYKMKFPNRFLNLGVAEQNMISFSSGLALTGYKVFIYNIIPFLLYRCYEQVRNDICYQRLPVTLVGIGSGVTYSPGGITHYSVEDIAVARTLPNLIIFSPSDPKEAERCIEYAMRSERPVYIRIAKSGEPIIHKNGNIDIERPIFIKEGHDVAVLFHGSIAGEVIKAIEGIEREITVISVPMIQPLDFEFILARLKNIHTLVTVEEHFTEGGLGSVVSEWIVKKNLPLRLRKLGISNEFIHVIKNTGGIRSLYGICSDTIRKEIENLYIN